MTEHGLKIASDDSLAVGRSVMGNLLKLVMRHRSMAFVVLVTGLVSSLLEGIGLSLFVPLFDALQPGGGAAASRSGVLRRLSEPLDDLDPSLRTKVLAAFILGAIVLRGVMAFANSAAAIGLAMKVLHDLRCRVFEKLLQVHFHFYERNDSGRIVSGLSVETNRTVEALRSLLAMASTGLLALVYLAMLLLLSWQLAIGGAILTLLVSLATKRIVQAAKSRGVAATNINRRFISRMLEVIEGMSIVRVFGRQTTEYARFERGSGEVASAWYRMNIVSEAVKPIYELSGAILLLLIFVSGTRVTQDISQLVLFTFLLIRLQPRLIEINRNRVSIHANASAIAETAALMAATEVDQPSGRGTLPRVAQGMRFEGVSYTYPNASAPSLDGIDLRIGAGEFVALVGSSGAGKTTLIKLLLRFYDPAEGRISVDGVDLRDLDVYRWRERIAVVAQESCVFNASIAENIGYGRQGATLEEIIEAAKGAQAHGFIERLPEGYDTIVGERGGRLSGGQKQRIALARAMIREPELFVLDEATNQLDALTEKAVQSSLMRMRHHCTMIVIAHRLSTVQHADKIVVMDAGRIVEAGGYAELVAARGAFRRLVDAQLLVTKEPRDEVA